MITDQIGLLSVLLLLFMIIKSPVIFISTKRISRGFLSCSLPRIAVVENRLLAYVRDILNTVLGRNSSKYDKYCRKQTTFLKDMFRHAYAIISLMSS